MNKNLKINPPPKQAVILAGGKGTRLKSILGNLPKPMLNVIGEPILLHLIRLCKKYGFIDIHILVEFRADKIIEYFGNGHQFGVNIAFHRESTPRGTAGALCDILHTLSESFIVLYGDTFLNVDLNSMWIHHFKKKSELTVFLHPNDHPYDSDLVEVDDYNMVKRIHTYPHKSHKYHRNLVNAALYVIDKTSLLGINFTEERPDIARNMFPMLLQRNVKISGYISSEYIKDIGTIQRIKSAETDIFSGKTDKLLKKRKKEAIFLDRDGVINVESGYITSSKDLFLIEGVSDAIRRINRSGMLAILITNQPVVARGECSHNCIRKIHNKLESSLGIEGAYLDFIYYCPHHPDKGFSGEIKDLKFDCNCRKPKPGMIIQAALDYNIDLEKSWMIGDTTSDVLAAKNAKVKSILVKTGRAGSDLKYTVKPDYVFDSLNESVDYILNN